MKRMLMAVLASAVFAGCDELAERCARQVVVTNVVTVTKTVVVTNAVEAKAARPVALSIRKTCPCAVWTDAMGAAALRKFLQEAGARVMDARIGSVASIEAPEKVIDELRSGGLVKVAPILPEEKIAAEAGDDVRIVPVSSIDCAAIAEAVRELGGELKSVVSAGSPVIRAHVDLPKQRKLAERGDVFAIRRDNQK